MTDTPAASNGPPTREELSEAFLHGPPVSGGGAATPTGPISRFGGKLFVVLLDDKTHPSIRSGRSLWGLSEALTYTPSNAVDTITVPKGFVTDLASIPAPFWSLLPPDGPWAKAAVIHDYLYYTQGTGCWKGEPRSITRQKDYAREEADWILRDAMADRGVDVVRRNIIYWAVETFGAAPWRQHAAREA